jgi:hypothetical protein
MQQPSGFNLSGLLSKSKARMAGGGLMGNRAFWYIAVAALPLVAYFMGQAEMASQRQQMMDQITNPQGFQQQQMPVPQMTIPGLSQNPNLSQNNGAIPYGLAPVDLPIENISQETNVWCWAAVSQQIIAASRGREQTPQQCALVATANNTPSDVCCVQQNPQCVVTGSLQQIQDLIQHYGGRSSSYAEPTDPMTLYRTLKQGHAVVIGLQTNPSSGHVVVARGMSFQNTPQGVVAMVHINDPMAQFTQPVPFQQIAGIWRQAIIVN